MAAKVVFPTALTSEWDIFRRHTVPGLFVYRHAQAERLLYPPDMGGGDMSDAQRREALDRCIVLHQPTTALVIFLNVVALEDFVRNLGINIAEKKYLNSLFLGLDVFLPKKKDFKPERPARNLAEDPFSIFNFSEVNKKYEDVIGIKPLADNDIPRLSDLSIIRHTVAHNGSIIRPSDVPRFQYYEVLKNQSINPPPEFVKETCSFLYKTGRQFEVAVRNEILKRFLDIDRYKQRNWELEPDADLIDLFELFNFFGYLPQTQFTYPESIEERKSIDLIIRKELVMRCIEDVKKVLF